MVQVILFCLAVGNNPVDLRMGIVNRDRGIRYNNNGGNSSIVVPPQFASQFRTAIRDNHDGTSTLFLSRIYIGNLGLALQSCIPCSPAADTSLLTLEFIPTLLEGRNNIRQGAYWGTMVFQQDFSLDALGKYTPGVNASQLTEGNVRIAFPTLQSLI